MVAWHRDDMAEALHAAYRTKRDAAVQPRPHALWLLRAGTRQVGEVAGLLGVNYWTIQRWVAWGDSRRFAPITSVVPAWQPG